MRFWPVLLLLCGPFSAAAEVYITVIQGLGGDDHYAELFTEQTNSVTQAATALASDKRLKTFTGELATRAGILAYFQDLHKSLTAEDRVAVILIGHGSYDGQQYKFNIPGPDLTGADLSGIMNGLPAQLQLLVNTSSASGAILDELKSDSRIVITATRSGNERNAPRFGSFFAAALGDHAADTNKNNAVSAAEAYEYANRLTQDYYKSEGQLATEHPQLAGERAGQFTLARLMPVVRSKGDPELERLLGQRREIDQQIEDLQLSKDNFSDSDEYYDQLQGLLLKLSLVEEQIEALEQSEDAAGD